MADAEFSLLHHLADQASCAYLSDLPMLNRGARTRLARTLEGIPAYRA